MVSGKRSTLLSLLFVTAAFLSLILLATPAQAAEDSGTTIAPEGISWTPQGVDLRERGVVTPVKDQSPWGTCWSFGTIAAAETSILSKENTTYEKTKLDLSERHLIYFANSAISKTTSETQAGEGLYFKDGIRSKNGYFNGGLTLISTTLFSSGAGPVLENDYPYHGHHALTEFQYALRNKEEYKKTILAGYKAGGYTPTKKEVEEGYKDALRLLKDKDQYSSQDDWSLSNDDRDKSAGYILIDGNDFGKPSSYDDESQTQILDQSTMNALKSELKMGRGISASFCADASSPGDDLNAGQYMNFNTYAHYTYDLIGDSHTICIVGYDDNYPKENFLQGITSDGINKAPPENGAWICKNSWGSETDFVTNEDGRPIGKGDFRLLDENGKHTGYFYLSYFDKSLTAMETYNFSKKIKSDVFSVYQYDYLASLNDCFYEKSNEDLACANVYVAEKDEILLSVGVRTAEKNSTFETSVYKLDSDSTDISSGKLLGKSSAYYDHAGYHRFAFDEPIHLEKDEKFAVALTTILESGKNYVQANMCSSKQDSVNNNYYQYGIAKVNPCESYIYKNGEWIEWTEYKQSEDFRKALKANRATTPEKNEVDNFTIKVYGIPEDESDVPRDPSEEESEKKPAKQTKQEDPLGKKSTDDQKGDKTNTPEKTDMLENKSSQTPKTGDTPIPIIVCIAFLTTAFSIFAGMYLRKKRCSIR